MELIQTLIVDDEVFVAGSLNALLDWESLGFKIAGMCYSARSALEFVRTHPVDLILCDIKMPEISGIDLISRIRNDHPNIESIIISGYSDFSYAQAAIRYGATAYCLKPFDEEETISALELVRKKILRTRRENEHILAELLFLSKNVPIERLQSDLRVLGFDLERPIYTCMLLGCTCDFTNVALSRHLKVGREKYLYLLQPYVSYDEMIQLLRHICVQNAASAGLDRIGQTLELSRHIEHARLSSMRGFISEKNEVVDYEKDRHMQSRKKRHFSSLLPPSGMNSAKRAQYIDQICALFACEHYSIRDAYHFYHLLASQCLTADQPIIFDCDGYESMEEEFKTMREMLNQVILLDGSEVPDCTGSQNWIQKIRDYCEVNYAEPISITIASDMVHISPSYFSTLFKKETGENFTAFVTKIRLEKARILLRSTQKNVSDIAIEVGYSDYYYFTKVFRKHFGVTPTDYRQTYKHT